MMSASATMEWVPICAVVGVNVMSYMEPAPPVAVVYTLLSESVLEYDMKLNVSKHEADVPYVATNNEQD